MRNTEIRQHKGYQWRRAIVYLMLGLLSGILFWVIVLWAALPTNASITN
ncbi:hypothetical protein SAMN03159341_11550 [Paenibacillus sp. 1_12]|nr:hypothetical protein [Paenibacillus sp. 1_12]SFM06018.1 hypothetical protein SAMN03159341_11550 [Paenibacillus sp. 1_12]